MEHGRGKVCLIVDIVWQREEASEGVGGVGEEGGGRREGGRRSGKRVRAAILCLALR